MKLHHTVYRPDAETIAQDIEKQGIIAQVAEAYKNLVPESIREMPVVWLTEGIWQSREAPVFEVDTKYLDKDKLHSVEFFTEGDKNLGWWVYQGNIPPNVLTRLT